MKKFCLIAFCLIGLLSCGPRYIYPHLDWLVPWYVSDYISLDDRQKDLLQSRLLEQIDWHCRTQLPSYAETLRAIGRDFSSVDGPLDYRQLQFHYRRLNELWEKLMKQIGSDIYAILITASDDQIDELFENLSKKNQEVKKEYIGLPVQQLNQNRRQRTIKRLKYWLSDLTAEQKELVSSWNARLVPLSEDWIQHRELILVEARSLLGHRSDTPEFRVKLLDLLVHPDQMRPPAYQAKIDANTETTMKFILQLDRTLSLRQRSYLLKRIESLASDFDALSCDPKEMPN